MIESYRFILFDTFECLGIFHLSHHAIPITQSHYNDSINLIHRNINKDIIQNQTHLIDNDNNNTNSSILYVLLSSNCQYCQIVDENVKLYSKISLCEYISLQYKEYLQQLIEFRNTYIPYTNHIYDVSKVYHINQKNKKDEIKFPVTFHWNLKNLVSSYHSNGHSNHSNGHINHSNGHSNHSNGHSNHSNGHSNHSNGSNDDMNGSGCYGDSNTNSNADDANDTNDTNNTTSTNLMTITLSSDCNNSKIVIEYYTISQDYLISFYYQLPEHKKIFHCIYDSSNIPSDLLVIVNNMIHLTLSNSNISYDTTLCYKLNIHPNLSSPSYCQTKVFFDNMISSGLSFWDQQKILTNHLDPLDDLDIQTSSIYPFSLSNQYRILVEDINKIVLFRRNTSLMNKSLAFIHIRDEKNQWISNLEVYNTHFQCNITNKSFYIPFDLFSLSHPIVNTDDMTTNNTKNTNISNNSLIDIMNIYKPYLQRLLHFYEYMNRFINESKECQLKTSITVGNPDGNTGNVIGNTGSTIGNTGSLLSPLLEVEDERQGIKFHYFYRYYHQYHKDIIQIHCRFVNYTLITLDCHKQMLTIVLPNGDKIQRIVSHIHNDYHDITISVALRQQIQQLLAYYRFIQIPDDEHEEYLKREQYQIFIANASIIHSHRNVLLKAIKSGDISIQEALEKSKQSFKQLQLL